MPLRLHRRPRVRPSFLVFAVLLLWVVGLPRAARAATITVTTPIDELNGSPPCSLREAIASANGNTGIGGCDPGAAGPDTITVGPGVYVLTRSGSDNTTTNGDLDVTEDVTIAGAGAEMTIIDGAWPSMPDRILEVLAPATATISGVTIQDGELSTTIGPGVMVGSGATLNLSQAVITSNEVPAGMIGGSGAGVAVVGTANISQTTISNNSGGTDGIAFGGGVYSSGTLTLTNVTVSGNRTLDSGGGVYVFTGTATLNNVTITGNTADSDGDGNGNGGGLGQSGTVYVRNTIVAGNTDSNPGTKHPDCSGTFASQGHNLIGTAEGCAGFLGPGDVTGVDPGLGPLAPQGGPTPTHRLLPGSPAIDAGDTAAPGSGGASCAAADQRGYPRADGDRDGTVVCDIGAFEVVPQMVTLKAKPRTVDPGEKTKLTARVAPCEGHAGDLVEFRRGKKRIARKALNDACKASKKVKVTKVSVFQAVAPADGDHAEGVSKKVKVKLQGG